MSCSFLLRRSLAGLLRPRATGIQFYHSSIPVTEPGREEAVVLSKDSEFLICWHPETEIPYECTQPLPVQKETDSALNVQFDESVKESFKRTHPYFENKKLQELTFTTKHRWFINPRIKYRSKHYKRDREYL